MIYVGLLLLLILVLIVGWCMTMLSMPGNWVIVAVVGLLAWWAPPSGPKIGWPVFFVLLGLAVVAELLELAASALGASRAGGSRRGAVLAIVGSMLGETWKGRTLAETWKVGQAAFWGRLLGALAKTGIATAMFVIAVVAAI